MFTLNYDRRGMRKGERGKYSDGSFVMIRTIRKLLKGGKTCENS